MGKLNDLKQYLLTQSPIISPAWRFIKGRRLKKLGKQEVFREKFTKNLWGGNESVSGPGSSAAQTDSIRNSLPGML